MDRPKRQSKAKWKYDEHEFVIPEEAAQMYWEANTRKVYRVLGFKDIKTSLKNTEVHILWPDDGKWYLAEVEQIRVKDMIAYLRYPETNEEEEASLQELIKDKCIAVIEHLPKDAKLKRGREIPVSEKDAEGAEYEDCESEPEQFQQQGSQQHNSTTPGSARKPKDEDSDFDAEEDSDAEVLSDDEKFDSDAHVSDDEVVSDQGEEGQGAAAAAAKHGSKKIKHKDGRKLNTPSRGTKQQRVSVGLIGPIAGPGPQQQQLLPMGSGAGGRTQAGGMMFVPTGATGVAAAGQNAASLGPFAGNSAQWGAAGQQGMLGKKRGSEGYPGNHAKRHAGASGGEDASGGDNATGSDAFKKAMLEKLLAKKSLAAGGGAAAGIAGAAAGGVGRSSSGFTVRKSIERRLSGSGSGGPLARALSDVDVRQKAAAQLAVGLKKAVEEAQAKHKQQQHQTQERDAAAAAGAAGEQQQQHGEQEAAAAVLQLPDPQKLATTIEQHLFELCGSVNNEYKSKLRSLAFNLRDPQNPDIREHVLKGEVAPANLVRMSAADLANKDLAEWRRKIEEEHNKAIELDVEAAAKFSTAAAWATREERLKQAELALMGILAQEKTRKATPEPERTPPYAEIAAAAAADQNQQQRQESEAGNVGLQEGREQQQQQSGSAGALAGEGEDWDAADAAGGGTPTHPADDGAATPTHPASEEGVDMEIDQLGHGMNEGSNGNAAAMGGKQMELQQQRSEQLSNLSGAAGAAPTGAADSAATPTVSASLGLPAGSVAGGVPGALQQLGSVTSKTTGGLLAGINWAAIKNEAMKSVPKEQQQAAGRQQQDAAAGTGVDVGAGLTAAAGTAATADDAPYNPDDDEDDGQPYDPSEAANVGAASGATAAVTASQGAQPAAAAGAAAIAPAVDPDLPDFLPVISARPKEAAAAPTPGDTVWHGSFAVPGSGTFAATVKHVGGMGEVGHMLGPAGSGIDVIGRVALDKFADFTEELRKSRSRTISLGVVGVAPGAAAVDTAFVHDLLRSYSSKGRIGKLALSKEVEGYLVAKSEYAARLLKTAIKVAPSEHQHLLPREVASSEFLLLLVHRKDYVPPRHGAVGRPPQQAPQQMPPTQMQQQQPMPGAPGLGVPPPSMQQAVPNSDTRLDPRRRAAAAGQQQQQAGVVPPPPPHIATPGPVADASPGPGQAAAAAPTIAGPAAGLDLNSLSALAAALGLPGGAPAAAATGNDAAAAAVTPASSNGAGAGLPWTTLGGVAATGEQLQLQQVPGGLPGPPAPPAPGGPPSGSAQGPSSGGAPAGLFAALQQLQQALPPPPPGAPGPGPDGQQQQQQYNTLDLRPMQGPPGAEQMVFDLRQQQQQQHLPPPPDLATLPPAPAPPAPGAAGGAPVIILPPGAAIPAPGTVGIPDGAVFMTQDPATGALIPVGGNMPPGTPILGPPGAPLPPGVFPPGHGPPPGPFASHGAPPPRPYDPMFADQPPPGYVFEGPPPLEFGLPPPPHHFGGPPRPRVPGGGPPRPMVRSQRGPPGGGPPRY